MPKAVKVCLLAASLLPLEPSTPTYLLPKGNQFQLLTAFSHSSPLHHTLHCSLKLIAREAHSSAFSTRRSSQSAKCGMKQCPLVGLIKKQDFKNISARNTTAHRWEFHMFDGREVVSNPNLSEVRHCAKQLCHLQNTC
jgi:hypothetical protein